MSGSRSFASVDHRLQHKLTTTPTKTADYTAGPWELVPCDATGGSLTVTLPAAAVAGQQVSVKLAATTGTNTVTVARAGTDTIDGATSTTLTLAGEAVLLTSSGSGAWTILASHLPAIDGGAA